MVSIKDTANLKMGAEQAIGSGGIREPGKWEHRECINPLWTPDSLLWTRWNSPALNQTFARRGVDTEGVPMKSSLVEYPGWIM